MSIEIIEKSTHKCEACACVFSFNQDDFQEISFRVDTKEPSYGHCIETWNKQTYVACPICGLSHVIKEKKETKEKWY